METMLFTNCEGKHFGFANLFSITSQLTDVVFITPLMVAVCCGPKILIISGEYTDQNPINNDITHKFN